MVDENLSRGAGGVARARLGRGPRRGARGGEPLLGDGEGHLADVRRRPAGGGAHRTASSTRTSSAAATSTPATARSTTRRRARTRRSRARGASCPTCRARWTSCRRAAPCDDDPARRDDWLIEAVPRDPRKVYKMRRIIEALVDHGSFFEIGTLLGPLDHHRPRAPRRLAGRAVRRRSDALRRRLDRATPRRR